MAVTYKDIDTLSQKSALAGTEKIPVSDTEYITPAQITESYLPTAGGTISKASQYPLVVNNSSSGAANVGLRFQLEGVTVGSLDIDGNTNVRFRQRTYNTTFKLWHEGNLSLASLAGTSAIGSADQCVYYNGSSLVAGRTITVSSSEPTSSDGADGDIWIVI